MKQKHLLDTRYDIWLGKFDANLNLLNQSIVASPTEGEDKGYGILFDGSDILYVTGTMTEAGHGLDIWLAKYDTNLNLLDSVALNGPVNGDDVAYSIALDENGNLYQVGAYSEAIGGSNIWIAKYDSNLNLLDHTTINGPANGYDSAFGVVRGLDGNLLVSGFIAQGPEGTNIWLARYTVSP